MGTPQADSPQGMLSPELANLEDLLAPVTTAPQPSAQAPLPGQAPKGRRRRPRRAAWSLTLPSETGAPSQRPKLPTRGSLTPLQPQTRHLNGTRLSAEGLWKCRVARARARLPQRLDMAWPRAGLPWRRLLHALVVRALRLLRNLSVSARAGPRPLCEGRLRPADVKLRRYGLALGPLPARESQKEAPGPLEVVTWQHTGSAGFEGLRERNGMRGQSSWPGRFCATIFPSS